MPGQYFEAAHGCSPCNTNQCTTCIENSTKCLSCESINPPKYLKGTSCLANCGEKFYANTSTGKCESCDISCLACSGPNKTDCLSCVSGSGNRYLHQGSCLPTCPRDLIANIGMGRCDPCPSTCIACDNLGCTACPGGFPPVDRNCKKICPQGQIWVPPNNCESCDQKCDFCSEITKACNINLSYQLKVPEFEIGYKSTDNTIQLELHVYREGGKTFSIEQVLTQLLNSSALKLTVKASQEVLPFTIGVNPLQTIILKVQKPSQITAG